MISISGQKIDSIYTFSDRFNMVLNCIKGGVNWLPWALENAWQTWHCSSEEDLLVQIQSGLHGNGRIRLGNLQVGVSKILQLNIEELEIVCNAGVDSRDIRVEMQQIQDKYQLISNQQLLENPYHLSRLELCENALFQLLDFNESVRLYRFLVSFSENEKIDQRAAEFATLESTSVEEFTHLYFFYRETLSKYTSNGMTDLQKDNIVKRLYAIYDMICNGLIFGINVPADNPSKDVLNELRQGFYTGKGLGFKSKAVAIHNLAKHVTHEPEAKLVEVAVNKFMAAVNIQLRQIHACDDFSFSQDGIIKSLHLKSEAMNIVVEINGDSVASISQISDA